MSGSSLSFKKAASPPITNLRSIALLAMLTALAVVSRNAFAFLPNIQPTTDIILITTLLMGIRFGLTNAMLTVLLSNLTLGMGTWTISQLIAYAVVVLVTGVFIRPVFEKMPLWAMAIYAGAAGLLYGFIISLAQAPIFGFDKLIPYYLAGLPFDLMHAGGNAVVYFVLGPILVPLLERLLMKYNNTGEMNM
ncbi:ECF transporter S component [Bacillus marinisedimentorum]|uniref:ECF transporter S component n=1 Tax=Bacillus marinisedimentorum TaxID=1821260 RepID=UPI001B80DA0F|nr:ECF transporter S component [Bacillus marinisedimentorum]